MIEDLRLVPGHIEVAEPQLSINELAKLVFVAHETEDMSIRKCALQILDRALNPLVVYYPKKESA